MARRNTAGSWLDVVAGLLSNQNKRPPRVTRRLWAERLEGRAVLSVAPISVEPPENVESLEEYLAQEQVMGPAVPAELAAPADPDIPAAAADQLLSVEQGEGEGEGEGEGSGSGGSGSGSGGSGSGSGGSGSGSGTGSGSGSPPTEPTIPEPELTFEGGTVTVSGLVEDDGDPSDLSLSLDGGIGSVTLNPDGTFTVEITDSQGNTSFNITVTDADGNATTYTFDY